MNAAVRRGLLWVGGLALAVAAVAAWAALHGGHALGPGRPAPDFTLPDLDGRSVSLAALRGGGDLALRFGSVTCTVCDSDWAVLGRWQAEAGPGLRLAAVEVGQPPDLVRLHLQGVRPPVPVLIDAEARVARAYGVSSLPSFAFVDRAGRLLAVRPVLARGGIWPDATWAYYLGVLRQADAAVGRAASGSDGGGGPALR
jgi:peroxiredoxin